VKGGLIDYFIDGLFYVFFWIIDKILVCIGIGRYSVKYELMG
jgi:hypothetical protein